MATKSDLDDVLDKLKAHGYPAKHKGTLISVDLNPELGVVRSYVVEVDREKLLVMRNCVSFDDDGNEEEDQCELGRFDTAEEAVEAILDSEEDF